MSGVVKKEESNKEWFDLKIVRMTLYITQRFFIADPRMDPMSQISPIFTIFLIGGGSIEDFIQTRGFLGHRVHSWVSI